MARVTGNVLQRRILCEMLSVPTAPFAEHMVIAHVERFCRERRNLTLRRDAVGNILVRVRKGARRISRPVCITAHLDHPGFIADRMTSRIRLRAHWRGGVPKEYFAGSRVQFFVDGTWVKGRVRSIKTVMRNGQRRVDSASIEVRGAVPPGSVGMWDFPDPVIKGQRIYARGCDDLAGAAAMLSAIDVLARGRGSCDAYFLFTRAEEVGFIGAIAAAKRKTIPKKCFVVAMETSSELPQAKMGDGPILRVGDRASAFTPAVTAYCHRIARELCATDRSFQFQRKLMDGGTCESAVYCEYGYAATGLCLALRNYHNMDRDRGQIAPESIHLDDFDRLVRWFVALAGSGDTTTAGVTPLRRRVDANYNRLARLLV